MVEIICCVISSLLGLVGTLLIVRSDRAKANVAQAIRDQKIEDRLCAVEKKLDEHNGYAEKFGETSISIAEIRKDIQYIKELRK